MWYPGSRLRILTSTYSFLILLSILGSIVKAYEYEIGDGGMLRFDLYPRDYESSCYDNEYFIEQRAWIDSAILANNFKWYRTYNLDDIVSKPLEAFFGKAWTDKELGLNNTILDNFDRLLHLHEGSTAKGGNYIKVHCNHDLNAPDELVKACVKLHPERNPQRCCDVVNAFTWIDKGWTWNEQHVVLCPGFFKTSSLLDKVREIKSGVEKEGREYATDLRNFLPNQAELYLYQQMHFHWVGQPDVDDGPLHKTHGPEEVAKLVETNPTRTVRVADAYSLTAAAVYQMVYFNYWRTPKFQNENPKPIKAAVDPTPKPMEEKGTFIFDFEALSFEAKLKWRLKTSKLKFTTQNWNKDAMMKYMQDIKEYGLFTHLRGKDLNRAEDEINKDKTTE